MAASTFEVRGECKSNMSSQEELIQYVIDTIDHAHSQKLGLNELLNSLDEAQLQVSKSADVSRQKVEDHYDKLQKAIMEVIANRKHEMLAEIKILEQNNLEPLKACEDMIQTAMADATTCMDQGKGVLDSNPEENTEQLLKFKESVDSQNLNMFPEVPSLHEVANIQVVFTPGFTESLEEALSHEGHVYERSPIHISEFIDRPGGLLVKWEASEDEVEASEFQLQYCYGQAVSWALSGLTFQTIDTLDPFYLVRRLQAHKPYSFRVRCRSDKDSPWSIWSVPRVSSTALKHYEWDESTPGYSTSNENKTGTRTKGLTRVLYSKLASYKAGFTITFKVLDTGEKSPMNGLGIAVSSDDIDTMKREGTIFLATDGTVYVDGQEMKTRLPGLSRNSTVTIETETLPNGKVRVSVQVEKKELTFDWKIDRQVTLGLIGGMTSAQAGDATQSFYFAMIFSHEDWKVCVE